MSTFQLKGRYPHVYEGGQHVYFVKERTPATITLWDGKSSSKHRVRRDDRGEFVELTAPEKT